MQQNKAYLPKIMRMLALGLILLGSLLLLFQDHYGDTELVAVGGIRPGAGNTVQLEILASYPGNGPGTVTVHLSELLRKSILKQGKDAEFLAVINRRGKNRVFERIFVLSPEEALQGTTAVKSLTLAVGTRPELVEMVGLDRFGYELAQPVWAKQKMPAANIVYYQAGTFDAVKEILDGGGDYSPNLYLLDAKSRIVGIRKTGGRLLTFPEFLRWASLVFYCLALVSAAGALIVYKWTALARAGRRIWDQVSKRGRRASN